MRGAQWSNAPDPEELAISGELPDVQPLCAFNLSGDTPDTTCISNLTLPVPDSPFGPFNQGCAQQMAAFWWARLETLEAAAASIGEIHTLCRELTTEVCSIIVIE